MPASWSRAIKRSPTRQFFLLKKWKSPSASTTAMRVSSCVRFLPTTPTNRRRELHFRFAQSGHGLRLRSLGWPHTHSSRGARTQARRGHLQPAQAAAHRSRTVADGRTRIRGGQAEFGLQRAHRPHPAAGNQAAGDRISRIHSGGEPEIILRDSPPAGRVSSQVARHLRINFELHSEHAAANFKAIAKAFPLTSMKTRRTR